MKVFWFFFSKKNLLPYFHSSVAIIANWYNTLSIEQFHRFVDRFAIQPKAISL
jgi:hypothetical protein